MTKNIAALLERKISSAQREIVQRILAQAEALGMPLYLVGGFVRDALLDRPVNDFDLVVEGDAHKLGRALVQRFGGRVTVHASFKTATWFVPETFNPSTGSGPGLQPSTLDLISARSETYEHPAALPTVQLGTIADDLRRRDFTINALAVRLDGEHFGELRDDLGGMDDLARGRIRVLHPRSFIDDPTRIFRAVRYAQRYGFHLASETEALIPSALRYVDALSPERLRHELDLIFEEDDAVPMLVQMAEMGVFRSIKPPLPWKDAIRARFERTRSHFLHGSRSTPSTVVHCRDCRWMVWLLELSPKEIHALAKRLHFTADLKKKVLAASAIFRDLDFFKSARPSECVARLDGLPEDAIRVAALCVPRGKARSNFKKYLSEWKNIKPFTNGETLKTLGVPPGPRYKEILSRLRAAWVDGEVTSESEEGEMLGKLTGKGR